MATPPQLGEVFQGTFSAAKYQSPNPIARYLVRGFLSDVMELVNSTGASDVHEVGCGEGQITGLLARQGLRVIGSDLDADFLAVARSEATRAGLQIDYNQRSIYELDAATDAAQLVLCCEVLEHLTDPERAMQKLVGITKEHLIVS